MFYNVTCVYLIPSLKAAIEAAERELAVLRRALVQKTASFMNMEEENRRLRENQMDQRRIKRQRQILKQGQVDVQRVLQEVMEEKAKLNVCLHVITACLCYTVLEQIHHPYTLTNHQFYHYTCLLWHMRVCVSVCVCVCAPGVSRS